MTALLEQPLKALIGAPGVTDVSPQVEAFTARMATLALLVGGTSSSSALTKALAAGSDEAFLGAFAELMAARGASAPGAQTLLRGRIALASALERSGGLWGADEAQAQIGVSRATLQNWRDTKKVLALQLSDGSFGYPVAQFAAPETDVDHPRPLPGMMDVLETASSGLTAAELIALLATQQPALGDRTGFQALAANDTAAVVALVAHVVTPADAGAPPARA
jgi:hypothetical protein